MRKLPVAILIIAAVFLFGFTALNVTAGGDLPAIAQVETEQPDSAGAASTVTVTVPETVPNYNDSAYRLAITDNSKELTIPEIVKKVADTVVEITTEHMVSGGFFSQYISEGAGSGVIISADGYIITNNHVVEDATKITVRMRDGSVYTGTLVGRDSESDIAVVKIEARNLPFAVFGDSDTLVVGELAVVIGNPLGELGGTVTEGIISALNRDISVGTQLMNLLQTSAAVNPGNSGGGLFNNKGEVMGIVNAKSGGTDVEGLGFAIPANAARAAAEDLIQYGYIPGRVDLGFTMVDVADSLTAMMYRVSGTGVYVSGPVGDIGLRSGDRIISVDGKAVTNSEDVWRIVDEHKIGDSISLLVQRGSQQVTAEIELKQKIE